MKIKIGLDGGGFIKNGVIQSGISREVYEFINYFEEINSDKTSLDCYFFKDKEVEESRGYENKLKSKYIFLPKKFYAVFFLPLYSLINNNAVFLGFSGYISPLFKLFGIKTVLFLHDFGFIKFPEKYKNSKKITNRTVASISRADLIIFFSEYQKKEFLRLFPEHADKKCIRIYPGLDHVRNIKLISDHKPKDIDGTFFLHVGVIKPMKNIESILEMYADFLKITNDYSVKLVLIGLKEADYYRELLQNPLLKKIKRQVIFYDKLPDDKLVYFYKNALATINAAFEEGFCFPIFETLYLGGVAIVLELPLYAEIAQNNANLMLCHSKKDVVEKMKMIYSVRSGWTNPSTFNREKIFTWKNFASELLNEIKSIR